MNDELYHHGIKGMKWGVRRTPAQLGHKPSKSEGSKSSSKTNNKVSVEKVKSTIQNGAKFVKDNPKLVLSTAARMGLTAAGLGYVNYLFAIRDAAVRNETVQKVVSGLENETNSTENIRTLSTQRSHTNRMSEERQSSGADINRKDFMDSFEKYYEDRNSKNTDPDLIPL